MVPWSKKWEKEKELAGCGRYIFKPNTPFANEWYQHVLNYSDNLYPQLVNNPGTYHPRAVPGGIGGGGKDCEINPQKYGNYPIPWGSSFGRLLQETMVKDTSSYMLGLPYTFKKEPNFKNYR